MNHNNRYQRQVILPEIGDIGQKKLQSAKVLVIGAGGLGCAVLQNLTMAGIGTLGIVDGDTVDITNLHRQLLYNNENIGDLKVIAAEKTLKKLNEEVHIEVFNKYLTNENAQSIISLFDIIIDCTDTIATRYLINDIALLTNKPVVYAAIHKFEGQVSVFNYNNGASYRCLFPNENQSSPTCESVGVLGILPNIIGLFQANEALKIVLEIGEVLSNKLLIYDALSCESQIIHFNKNDEQINIGLNNSRKITEQSAEEIDWEMFIEKCKDEKILKIDLRTNTESFDFETNNIKKISIEALFSSLDSFNKKQETILFCNSGNKSKFALENLKKAGFENAKQLKKISIK